MKKVLLTFYGLVDELSIGELTQKEFEDCKEHRISPKDCDLGLFLGGWNEIESLDVNVDGQEVYSDSFDIEDEDCPHIVNTNPKDWNVSGCSEDQQKALAEEIAALGGNWEEEDSNDVFRNVFGFKKTLQAFGVKDGSPVAVQENLGIRACYYYEFEIPDDEEFDISKVKFAIDDSEFFSDCGERVVWSTIMYGNMPVALDEGNEDSSESIEFGFGIIHTNDSTGYIDYVESNIPYFDDEDDEDDEEEEENDDESHM